MHIPSKHQHFRHPHKRACARPSIIWEADRLHFFSQLDETPDNVMDIFSLAHRFGMNELLRACAEVLDECMNCDDVCRVLEAVDFYQNKALEAKCWELIRESTPRYVLQLGYSNPRKGVRCFALPRLAALCSARMVLRGIRYFLFAVPSLLRSRCMVPYHDHIPRVRAEY